MIPFFTGPGYFVVLHAVCYAPFGQMRERMKTKLKRTTTLYDEVGDHLLDYFWYNCTYILELCTALFDSYR